MVNDKKVLRRCGYDLDALLPTENMYWCEDTSRTDLVLPARENSTRGDVCAFIGQASLPAVASSRLATFDEGT